MRALQHRRPDTPDPRLERALRRLVVVGVALVVLLPMARAQNPWVGALPLWLVGMPLASWWALHRFSIPGARAARSPGQRVTGRRRRRVGPQALRRAKDTRRPVVARVA